MASIITLKAIDQAIINLRYSKRDVLPYRFVTSVRQFYENEDTISSIRAIDKDDLIRMLWDTGNDPGAIKKKRKNLSSIKSYVNANLKKLYHERKNPAGIIIGRNNIFVMCDEAKDEALKIFKHSIQVGGSAALDQIIDILHLVAEVVSNKEGIASSQGEEESKKLRELQGIMRDLWGSINSVPYEAEEIADFDQVEAMEELKDIEVDEVIEETEFEDELMSEPKEDLAPSMDVESARVWEDGEVVGEIQETDVGEEFEEAGISGVGQGEEYNDEDYGRVHDIENAKVLAEEFNGLLSVMDRYYNQYVLIPKGAYRVGSKQSKEDEEFEKIAHLPSFYMGKFPVTNALFEVFVEKTGYETIVEKLGYGTVYYGRIQRVADGETGLPRVAWNAALIRKTVQGACWYQPLGPGSTLHNKKYHPVVHIALEDAMAFASWTGKRLPTDDEWEAASRTGHGFIFPWGNEWKKDACNIEESCIGDTTPVDCYMKFINEFGIVDTIGNVLEMTLDQCEVPDSTRTSSHCIIAKGGSWISSNQVKLYTRFKVDPELPSNILGFRCVAY